MVPSMSPISAGCTIRSWSERWSSSRTERRAWAGDIDAHPSKLSGRIPNNVLSLLGTPYGRATDHRPARHGTPRDHAAAARPPLAARARPPRHGRAGLRAARGADAQPVGGHRLRDA